MTKKSKSKKAKTKTMKAEPKSQSENEATNDSSKAGFDFGGLPDRDLKKNLGCG